VIDRIKLNFTFILACREHISDIVKLMDLIIIIIIIIICNNWLFLNK